MKYTIMGFNQAIAVKLGLGFEHLAILKWFCDLHGTEVIPRMEVEGESYYLVVYATLTTWLPILKAKSRRQLSKYLNLLTQEKVLDNVLIREGGTFNCYKFGENFQSLLINKQRDC